MRLRMGGEPPVRASPECLWRSVCGWGTHICVVCGLVVYSALGRCGAVSRARAKRARFDSLWKSSIATL